MGTADGHRQEHAQSGLARTTSATEQIIDALGLRRVTLPSKQDVLKRLKEEVARAGSHTEYARLTGLDRTHLTHVLNGRNPGPEIMKALNITSVVRYVRETSANPLRGA